jgi:hypothetical protein
MNKLYHLARLPGSSEKNWSGDAGLQLYRADIAYASAQARQRNEWLLAIQSCGHPKGEQAISSRIKSGAKLSANRLYPFSAQPSK